MNKINHNKSETINIFNILVLFSLLVSCINQENLIEKHFSNQDVKLLDELVRNFKKSICLTKYSENCLSNYLESIRDSFNLNNSIETNLNATELENIIDKYVDNGIFSKHCGTRNFERNLEVQYYCLNSNGKYLAFLSDLGNRSKVIAEYSKSLYQFGDIGPKSTAGVIFNFEEFNFSNEENLVLLVIHYTQKELEWYARDKLMINEQN